MSNPPPPYSNITGTSAVIAKYNQQESIANANGNARPGQLVIDVTNNNTNATPPQEPILKTVNNIGMKIWKNNYSEASFSDVGSTLKAFIGDPGNNTGYSSNPLTGLKVGDVIAFQVSNNLYALIYIKYIENGLTNPSSGQTFIQFRAIYPIILP